MSDERATPAGARAAHASTDEDAAAAGEACALRDKGLEPALDPRALEKAAAGWDNRLHAALLGLAMLLASAWPWLFEAATRRAGPRTAALAVALAALASAARTASPAGLAAARSFAAAFVGGLALAAVATGRTEALRLLPAVVHLMLAAAFFASLAHEESLVERGARLIQPMAPPFIGPWCRGVTAMWGMLLAASAAVLAWTAVAGDADSWRFAAGPGLWSVVAAASLAEFLARKTWFRNYWYGGPFERLWSRWFPAEATEMGRRSAEWIRVVRAGLEDRERQAASAAAPPSQDP